MKTAFPRLALAITKYGYERRAMEVAALLWYTSHEVHQMRNLDLKILVK